MPELPEVETVVRALRGAITGARIGNIVFASRRVAAENSRHWRLDLCGRTIRSVERRGKYILLYLLPNGLLVMHLRMTGRLRLRDPEMPRERHDRLILSLGNEASSAGRHLVLVDTRQFARTDWCPNGNWRSHPGLAKLGPEATDISETQLRRVCAQSLRPIKALLIDQTRIAGLGNIYADESLFAARIHPSSPCDGLDRPKVRRLRDAIHRILAAAIAACGTTFDTFSDLTGNAGGFAPQLMVYGRDGEPCHVCLKTIERIVIVGRGTHFCPRCQKAQRVRII